MVRVAIVGASGPELGKSQSAAGRRADQARRVSVTSGER